MSLDKFENEFFKTKKQKTDMIFKEEDCINSPNLPCGKLFEVKSGGSMACLELSLQWLGMAQKNGICVMVDSEFNCTPESIRKYDVDPSELLYVPVSYPQENYDILYKLLELKDIRLIVISTATLLFPLVHDIKRFTTLFSKLKEKVQESNASVLILNPYYELGYDIFSKTFNCTFESNYRKKLKNSVEINVKVNNNSLNFKNEEFIMSINYI